MTLEAVAFTLLGRAPASHVGIPGSRTDRCDGADRGSYTYREEIQNLAAWCDTNNLVLNIRKPK